MTATLYLVPTPIGNLSDLAPRAQQILSQVSFILCEDTRHTLGLLQHFQIKNSLESLHVHNEKNKINGLIEKILQSKTQSAALVSDAGTPAICDPGAYLVAAAHGHGLEVISLPGPSSLPSALAASGFIQPRTLFSGFLSKNKQDQWDEFHIWSQASPCLAVFFESPKRVLETLKNLAYFFTQKKPITNIESLEVCLSREISKKFEEHKRSTLLAAIDNFQLKSEIQGEFVICCNIPQVHFLEKTVTIAYASKEAFFKSQLDGIPLKQSCKEVGQKYSLNPKDIYACAMEEKEALR